MSKASKQYTLSTSLAVLEDLGINLYTNSAAVLTEIVANAWDADARQVDVVTDSHARTLSVRDDGIGMTEQELNAKFLTVGYKRREHSETKTKSGRSVMGRKGIGKLSAFSLAEVVEVHTIKGREKRAFRMVLSDIKKRIAADLPYHPEPIAVAPDLRKGTLLILKQIKPKRKIDARTLRRRLARRFAIADGAHDFTLTVNSNVVTLEDREYYDKFQYLWYYGEGQQVVNLAKNASVKEPRASQIKVGRKRYKVHGWLASAATRQQLKSEDGDNLNRVTLMVRLKLAHEDLLEQLSEAGVYSKYLIGEMHADFLDLDNEPDIATSSRQRIMEDDERFEALTMFLKRELNHIKDRWTDLRNEEGRSQALEIPEINRWYNGLGKDEQRRATSLLGKVNALPLDSRNDKRIFFKQAILAFEIFRVKRNLDALEDLEAEDIDRISALFDSVEDIEATYYYEIVKQRIEVINALGRLVEDDAKERFLQEHVFDALWLIEPSWERATESHLEVHVQKMLDGVTVKLPEEYRAGRVDIKHRLVSGRHVIIELKKASRVLGLDELNTQIRKYHDAMEKLLERHEDHQGFEIIILLGKPLREERDAKGRDLVRKTLALLDARIIQYDALQSNALSAYKQYLQKHSEASRLSTLLSTIDEADFGEAPKGLAVPGKYRSSKPPDDVKNTVALPRRRTRKVR